MRLLIAFLFLLVACDSTPPPQTVLTLSIEGMHCNSCVQSITAEIDKIDGVTSCVVTLEENNAVVTVTDEALAQTILQNIRRLQFKCRIGWSTTNRSLLGNISNELFLAIWPSDVNLMCFPAVQAKQIALVLKKIENLHHQSAIATKLFHRLRSRETMHQDNSDFLRFPLI